MSFIAFEVSINGDRQYTVGAENWKHISAILSGHYINPSRFPPEIDADNSELPSEPISHVQLWASVAVSGEDVQITDPEGHVHTESKSGSYPAPKLSPGDVVEIRVIETDSADSPEWAKHDPRFPGHAVIRSSSDERSGHSSIGFRVARYTLRINELMAAIESAIVDENWVAALFVALSIPDICGYLESPREGSGVRYERWFQKYVAARYSMRSGPELDHHQFFLGSDCYALRCAMFHEGRDDISEQRAREVMERIHFIEPPESGVIHCNRINNVLQLQVDFFCRDIVCGLKQWQIDIEDNSDIQDRMDRSLKIYKPNDHIHV